jgi:hypothetical protein
MPILGIMASQISGHLWAPEGAYDALATVTLSASASSISFVGIPSGYKHLQLRGIAQTNRGTYGIDEANLRFNSDTGANYAFHLLYGDGSSATATATSGASVIQVGSGNLGTTTGSNWGTIIVDILDYTNTNKYTTVRTLGGADCNGTVGGIGGRVGFSSGLWTNTAAVTSMLLVPVNGSNFSQYSQFALYGVK